MSNSMDPSILQGTLNPVYTKGPQLTGKLNADIKTFSGAYHPGLLGAFSSVMQNIGTMAYKDRQSTELKQIEGQVDPTKVSGQTFKGIVDFVEGNRGADVTKINDTTMNAYTESQRQIGATLGDLKAEKARQVQNFASIFGYEPDEIGKKEEKMLKKYYKAEKEYNDQKKALDLESSRLSVEAQKKSLKGGSGSSTANDKKIIEANKNATHKIFTTLAVGDDKYVDPQDWQPLLEDWKAADMPVKDFFTEYAGLINPFDDPYRRADAVREAAEKAKKDAED